MTLGSQSSPGGTRAPRFFARPQYAGAPALAAILVASCGIDNVPVPGPPAVSSGGQETEALTGGARSAGGSISSGGWAGEDSAQSGGGPFIGGVASFGVGGAFGEGSAVGGASSSEYETQFFACAVNRDRIEVRGVREGCWLVVIERNVPEAWCQAAEQGSGWCVVDVLFGQSRTDCAAEGEAEFPEFVSEGMVQVGKDATVDLDLEFKTADGSWFADKPFTVFGCHSDCGDQDCRE
jgi:hypothetical protein